MDKLNLEILSAYLPYKVKVSRIHELNTRGGIGGIEHMLTTRNEQYKLRLHPLSIQFLTSIIHHADDMEEVLTAIEDDTLLQIRHDLFTEIVKNHGDIFGLIPLGLAVDKRGEV